MHWGICETGLLAIILMIIDVMEEITMMTQGTIRLIYVNGWEITFKYIGISDWTYGYSFK